MYHIKELTNYAQVKMFYFLSDRRDMVLPNYLLLHHSCINQSPWKKKTLIHI